MKWFLLIQTDEYVGYLVSCPITAFQEVLRAPGFFGSELEQGKVYTSVSLRTQYQKIPPCLYFLVFVPIPRAIAHLPKDFRIGT